MSFLAWFLYGMMSDLRNSVFLLFISYYHVASDIEMHGTKGQEAFVLPKLKGQITLPGIMLLS